MIRLRAKEDINPELIYEFLNSYAYWSQISEMKMGSAQPNVNAQKLKKLKIPLAPKGVLEQVNNLLSGKQSNLHELENLIEKGMLGYNTSQNATNLFVEQKDAILKLRQSILQEAVQGKLTQDWRANNPDTENASVLLKRIQEEKAQLIKDKKIKKEKPLPPITKEEISYELPDGWVWCKLGQYVHYGALSKYENKDANNATWVLELEDIKKESSKLLKKVRFIERDFKSTKSVFKSSDVIYGKLRPYLDKVIVADEDGVCTTEMIPIKSFSNCSPEYLRWFLKHPGFIEYANGSTHGMRMPRMGTDVAKNAIISIPPLEEQKAIVQKVNAFMGLCNRLEQEVQQSQEHSEQLMQSCLREVFTSKETKDELINSLLPELDTLYNVANLQQAMIVQKTEIGLGSGRGKVYLQKTSANLKNIKKVAIGYTFEKSHHGEFSWQLSEDLDKNPYLRKVATDYGEIYEVKPDKQQEVLKALNSSDNFSFVQSMDELIEVYKNKLINGSTDRVELLNTVCKAIADTQSVIGNTVYAYMQDWEIKQKGYKTKADKFTQSETFAMIQLVTQVGWNKELIS